jgi:hypothetical protein
MSKKVIDDPELDENQASLWDLEGCEWRLINVFNLGDGKMVGAYCPSADFQECMLEQTRKALVVENPSVEVALMADIKTWISASAEMNIAQQAAASGGRQKRRKPAVVPKRNTRIMKKWRGNHDDDCMECGKGSAVIKCYGCNVVAHKKCAMEANHNNILCQPNGTERWTCNECYFDTHGGGPEPK